MISSFFYMIIMQLWFMRNHGEHGRRKLLPTAHAELTRTLFFVMKRMIRVTPNSLCNRIDMKAKALSIISPPSISIGINSLVNSSFTWVHHFFHQRGTVVNEASSAFTWNWRMAIDTNPPKGFEIEDERIYVLCGSWTHWVHLKLLWKMV